MTFGRGLVGLHTARSMLQLVLVQAWRYYGSLNKEHSISAHFGSLKDAKRVWPSMNHKWSLIIRSQTLSLSMHYKWKEFFDIVYKINQWKIIGDQPFELTRYEH